ncbi:MULTISPECIES: AAA family ATPase [unclassified Streptomyces]|uniref:AAA family ATPase n=1 Tax=unclassified Streptomyces TaxID=2593676 RepID=UPI0009A477DA|nr:AAA family ATPase [Streptomyces sp. 3211]
METGTEYTRLIVVRGNSASGKSSVAAGIRARCSSVAVVGQDNMRRVVLGERDRPGAANIGLIDTVARYALNAGYHVVLEGILYSDRYGDMLARLMDDHRGTSHGYYLNVPFAETLIRHATKTRSGKFEYGETELRAWYRDLDLLPDGTEIVIDGTNTLQDTVEGILADSGLG